MAQIQGNLDVVGQVTANNFIGAVQGVNNIQLPFSFSDATPVNVFIAKANELIEEIQILILTAFDGAGASLEVGDATLNDRLVTINQNDPTIPATYIITPNYSYVSSTQVLLTIDPGTGATQGSGLLLIRYKV